MTQHLTVSQEQTLHLANAAIAAGNMDEATALMKQIPLAPELAYAAKQALGAEFLRNSGFDLSEAEKRYGQDWLAH